MIQDIFPHKLNNQFRTEKQPQEKDAAVVFRGEEILLKASTEKELLLPTIGDVGGMGKWVYLFSVDEKDFYLLFEAAHNFDLSKTLFHFQPVKSLREQGYGPKEMAFALMTAGHLAEWYRDNRFCGRCGQRTEHSGMERALVCPKCGYISYPRIMPAVIVGVTNGDEIVLTRYRSGYAHNALIAGFTEIGETAEETVAREVMEEVGLRVKNIRYYKSQPWGMANDLLLGFFCEVDGSTSITMDEGELKQAEWVKREDIVLQPDDYSLTNEMMSVFKNGYSPFTSDAF